MGTRADFYVGRGDDAEWLGSTAWDGHPGSVFGGPMPTYLPSVPLNEKQWRNDVATWFASRDDATLPEDGWPWPWEDSQTTDYAYAFDPTDGAVWGSYFGHDWFLVSAGEPEEDEDTPYDPSKTAVFPNMKDKKNVARGKRSGLIVIGPNGIE